MTWKELKRIARNCAIFSGATLAAISLAVAESITYQQDPDRVPVAASKAVVSADLLMVLNGTDTCPFTKLVFRVREVFGSSNSSSQDSLSSQDVIVVVTGDGTIIDGQRSEYLVVLYRYSSLLSDQCKNDETVLEEISEFFEAQNTFWLTNRIGTSMFSLDSFTDSISFQNCGSHPLMFSEESGVFEKLEKASLLGCPVYEADRKDFLNALSSEVFFDLDY